MDEPKGETTQPSSEETPETPSDTTITDSTDTSVDISKVEVETGTKLSEDQAASLKKDISKDVADKVSKKVSKTIISKIGEALGLTKTEEEKLPSDPEKLQKFVESLIEKSMEKEREKLGEEAKQTQAEQKKKINTIVNNWFSQYNRLSQAGKVPAIKNVSDPNDPGVQARKRIITYIGQMVEKLKESGSDYTPSIADALLENPRVLSGPAGATLPISGNTASTENSETFKYDDMHRKSFEEIAQGA
ncbi:MAG: hypothetical protein ACYSTS_11935 [Planctomycetota bacterium]|jgi:hypothetical protein